MGDKYFTNRGTTYIISEYFSANNVPASFKLALCAKQNENNIDNAAAVDKGGGKVGIPVTTHGYSTGEGVKIIDTTNYDGYYIVDSTSTANEVVIVATYVAETFAGTEYIHEAPGPDINVLTDLTEIAAGNGYTAGGAAVARNTTTGFDSLTEDDTNDLGSIQLQDVTWTASGGSIPSSGNGARYVVLVDDSANVICFWDLDSDVTVTSGQQLTIQDGEIVARRVSS
jgi:hypothetical protein